MRKTIIILGFVLSAILMEGVVFFFSSRIPAGTEVVEADEAPAAPSNFDELMSTAITCREQRRFDTAFGFVRLALDQARTKRERVDAGYQMGCLLFEDFRRGGTSQPEAAALYLQAAYDSAGDPHRRVEIGLALLDVLEARGETAQFAAYLEEMLASASAPGEKIELWRRKFGFLLGPAGGWREMNIALAKAENLPLHSGEWVELVAGMRLRTREKLLADAGWFDQYARTMGLEDTSGCRQELFAEVRSKLERMIKDSDPKVREEALLRLARALVSIGDHEGGHACLKRFIEMDPTENLMDALVLFSRVSRIQGEVAYAAYLAESLIRRFDFNKNTRDEILQVVTLLEEHGLYTDALGLLEGCFSLSDTLGKEYATLVGRAAVLEERLGHHLNAQDYMNQLHGMEGGWVFEETLSEMIDLCIAQGDYASTESWIHGFIGRVPSGSGAHESALFALFEAKYWLNRPVLEQLYVGAAAIQAAPEDPRTASVELRMARYVEDMKLHDLAISYYNRIGLLNFFQGDAVSEAPSQNIGEQAMLGKARCLNKAEDWVAADHLYRDLCNRTKSPLVKSEAAVGWAGLALRFGQNREAERRYDLAHVQMLSGTSQVYYRLGRSQIEAEKKLRDLSAMEDDLELLANLPEEEQRNASIDFFNETFDYLHQTGDERAMLRMIDLAYQSEFTEWLPIQSYVLRLYEDKFQHKKIGGLGSELREKDDVAGASMVELAQVVGRMEALVGMVKRHRKKGTQ